MPNTAAPHSIWFPDANAPYVLETLFSTQAQSTHDALTRMRSSIDASLVQPSQVILSSRAAALAAGFVETAGFQIRTVDYRILLGQAVSLFVYMTRTGANISAGATGDITNEDVIQLPSFLDPAWTNGSFHEGFSGSMKNAVLGSNGRIRLSSMAPNSVLKTNDDFSLGGVYFL